MLSVIGKVNKRLREQLKINEDAPYYDKALEFTSVSNGTPTKFPTLSVVSLGDIDSDSSFEHDQHEAIWSTIELKAYSNTTMQDCTKLLNSAGDVMYSMFYDRTYENTLSDIKPFCKVARYRRKVGNEDNLY